jgi:hypothetical protein
MPFAAAIPLITAGLGAVGSAIGASSGKKTAKQEVSAPSYTPAQMGIQDQLSKAIQGDLANPANLNPQKALAIGQINQNTDNLQRRLQGNESARGFGASGRMGMKSSSLEIGRTNQLGGLEDQFAQMQLDQNNRVRAQAQQFGFTNPTVTKTGTETESGSGLAAGLGAGSESLTTLYYLNKLLKQKKNTNPAPVNGADIPIGPSGGFAGDEGWGGDSGFGSFGDAGAE